STDYKYISIHAPRVGCDVKLAGISGTVATFQSTHPVWGATKKVLCTPRVGRYFNPRTPCGVRLVRALDALTPYHFNPRTPCGVRRLMLVRLLGLAHIFQSTHPV